MNFFELTAAEAEAYRALVEADGPARLYELAQRLTADGVPLDQFDATIPSLEPLWRWYLEFARADFPGIPADAEPRTKAVEAQGARNSRACYAAELLAHYLFEVARTCFTGVEWISNPRVGTGDYQRAAVRYIDDDGFKGLCHLDRYTKGVTLVLQQGEAEFEAPDFLAKEFLLAPFLCGRTTAARCRSIARGESILTGLPRAESAPGFVLLRDDTSGSPLQHPLVDPGQTVNDDDEDEADGDDEVGGELVFAHITADIEELEEAPPLDLGVILPVLTQLGFRNLAGAAPTTAQILAEEFAEFVRNDDAIVTTMVAGGALRAVQLASISPTAPAWAEITGAFTHLAGPLNARLAPEDEF